MTNPITPALRLLSHFWLEEVKPEDTATIAALPELAEALPTLNEATLTDLAVEYQRLFGFNLPPYESIFIDPSAMLLAPATERVQALYREARWQPPAGMRSGAPDHLGLELLALAEQVEADFAADVPLLTTPAQRLHTEHVALWLPPFVFALRQLTPHPFYATLGDLSLDLILTTLPHQPRLTPEALFPPLPPPPMYRGSEELVADSRQQVAPNKLTAICSRLSHEITPSDVPLEETELPQEKPHVNRQLIKHLLPPREAGLFITRQHLAQISYALDLPSIMGERYRILDTLFRQATQYDLLPALIEHLGQIVAQADDDYQNLAAEYPAWQPYSQAWRTRLATTQAKLKVVIDEQ